MAQYTTAHLKDVTSTACREHLCFPATHGTGKSSVLQEPEEFPEQGADEKMMLSLLCFATALMPAVSYDVEFHAILLGFFGTTLHCTGWNF